MRNMKTTLSGTIAGWTAAGLGLLLLSGCTTTQKADLSRSELNCGMLGRTCSLLKPGTDDQMAFRYVNPTAKWAQYNKVMIEPVSYWGGDKDELSSGDQQAVVDYFNQKLNEELGKKFTVVAQPGPGVMKLQVALVHAETATPGLRTISMAVPQAHMLSNLGYVATGKFPFVGSAQVEAKVTDAASGELLAAVADKRLGGGSFTTAFQWTLGDAQNAMNHWAENAAERLSAWTSGAERPL